MQHRRTLPLLVAAVLVVGIILGFHVRDVASGTDDRFNEHKIEEAYNVITQGYVERVDSAQLAESAIEGMLAALDPHSIYISSTEMRDVRESFNASFEGIGIYYELLEGPDGRDTLAVLMPIAGGPSEEAGLQPGDRIIQIDDTTAIGFTTDLVQRYLKGPAGTGVTVQVLRPGYTDTLSFDIVRDRIPLETVIAAYMLDDETGYVKLQRFARTSHAEVLEAIRALRAEGMERLVFDLRGNAGGLLEQAWQIADEFLPASAMVVYTNSRHPSNNREYRATSGGTFEEDPVILLVDENSASASEIVAGALQDHDRGLIVGRRTFGKGLVQQQFPLSDGSVLQMTVSRYYTPAGRLIQTPYVRGDDDDEYFEAKRELRDLMEGNLPESGLLDVSRFADEVPDSLKYRTDGGRVVFGGGGILPDYLVRLDSLSPALQTIIGRNLDNEFARYRLEQLGESFRQEWSGREAAFLRTYDVDDATFDAFLAWADDHGVDVVATRPDDPEGPILVESEALAMRADVEARIKAFMARRLFGVDAFYPVVAEIDRTLQEAMGLWREASTLAEARPGR
ncbi:MAG: S41 family peptidase [Rubricoccaceae bacterium]|nr:S41 family peptidase [Rubricoccaceae bacterium]